MSCTAVTETHRAHGCNGLLFTITCRVLRVDLGPNRGQLGVQQVCLGVCFQRTGLRILVTSRELP